MNGISIGDITTGYSFSGAVEYVERLNAEAIVKTKEAVANIDGIRAALEKGWSGQAELNFIANLEKSTMAVQGVLDSLKRTLDSQFAQLEQNMVEQDNNMIPLG